MLRLLFTLLLASPSPKAYVCDSSTPIQTVRDFFWIIMGFPGNDEYQCVTTGDAAIQQVIPQGGLVGDLDTLRSFVSTAVRAKFGTSATCADIPNSGSSNVGPGKTIYYEAPQFTIPATFPSGGGRYQKRVRFVNTNTSDTVKFEFDCANERIFAYRYRVVNGKEFHIVTVYDNTTSTKYVDTYFYDGGLIRSTSRINMAVAVRVNSAANKFQLWMTRTGYDTSSGPPYEFDAYRFTAHVNYS